MTKRAQRPRRDEISESMLALLKAVRARLLSGEALEDPLATVEELTCLIKDVDPTWDQYED